MIMNDVGVLLGGSVMVHITVGSTPRKLPSVLLIESSLWVRTLTR